MSASLNVLLVCPILNPEPLFDEWQAALGGQNYPLFHTLIIDSGSVDGTVEKAVNAGFLVKQINQSEFNHGATRQQAVNNADDFDLVVFLTQDAILASPDAIKSILHPFNDTQVTAVCGRQLPRKKANPIEAHARLFNYGIRSFTRSMDDVKHYGLKTAFISNSFAAYRISALQEVGGFPNNVIFGEDMYVAAKMLKAGYKIAYAADACVYHSHGYKLLQEFRRYFDMGVFHAREPWIRQQFGGAEGEGLKFVISEMKYLFKHAFWRIPAGLLRKVFGYIGFRLGLIENRLPVWLKRKLAMNKGYFAKSLKK